MIILVAHDSRVKIPEFIYFSVSFKICSLYLYIVGTFHGADHARYAQAPLVARLASALSKNDGVYHIIDSVRFRFCHKHPSHDSYLRRRNTYAHLSPHGLFHIFHGLSYSVCDLAYFSAFFPQNIVAFDYNLP